MVSRQLDNRNLSKMKSFSEIKSRSVQLIKVHRWAIILAIVVAFIYGMPQVIAMKALGSDYHGFPYLINDSEGEYMSRIHEFFDGNYAVSSPVFHEYKDSPSMIPPTGEFIFYALPVYITGLSLDTIVFLSRFILPASIFVFIYMLVYSISSSIGNDDADRNKRILSAISGGLLIALGTGIINYRDFLAYILHGGNQPALLLFSRLVNPVSGMILLSLFLLVLWKVFDEKPCWPSIVTSSIILALMSGYIFSFALGLTISSLLAIYLLIRRNWKGALKMAVVPLGAIFLNGIYFLGVLHSVAKSSVTNDPLRSGMFYTHVPTVNMFSILILVIFAICFFVFSRKNGSTAISEIDKWWWFALSIVLVCIIVYIQQSLTGVAVWPQHFAQYTVPLGMLVIVILLENAVRPKWLWLWKVGIAAILFVSIVLGLRSIAMVAGTIPQFADQQTFVPVIDWLNKNAPRSCVVYVASDYGNEINRFIPGFTSCDVYHSYYNYSGVPMDRVMHNFLVNLRLRGVKPADVAKHFKDNWFWTDAEFFRDYGDMFCCADPWLAKIKSPAEITAYFDGVEKDIEKQYDIYLKQDLSSELNKYQLDYFVVDTEKMPQVNPKNFGFLVPKAALGRFDIYSMNNTLTATVTVKK